jgi:hypothetical protein
VKAKVAFGATTTRTEDAVAAGGVAGAAGAEATVTSRTATGALNQSPQASSEIAGHDRMTRPHRLDAALRRPRATARATTMTWIVTRRWLPIPKRNDDLGPRGTGLAMTVLGSDAVADDAEAVDGPVPMKPPSDPRRIGTAVRPLMRSTMSLFPSATAVAKAGGRPPAPTTVQSGQPVRVPAREMRGPVGDDDVPVVQQRELVPRPTRPPHDRNHWDGPAGSDAAILASLARRVGNVGREPTFRPFRAVMTRTTRASSFLASRRPFVRGHLVLVAMTPTISSKKAVSARCSTCRAGSRPSAS